MESYKTYNNADFCPIYNFTKASEDLRYLLKLDDYSELPEIQDKSFLKEAYSDILYSIETKMNLRLPRAKMNFAKELNNYVRTNELKHKSEAYGKLSALVRLADENIKSIDITEPFLMHLKIEGHTEVANVLSEKKVFNRFSEMFDFLRKKLHSDKSFNAAFDILESAQTNYKKQNLLKDIVSLEQVLSRSNIDEKTTSVNKFYQLVNLANNVNKKRNVSNK